VTPDEGDHHGADPDGFDGASRPDTPGRGDAGLDNHWEPGSVPPHSRGQRHSGGGVDLLGAKYNNANRHFDAFGLGVHLPGGCPGVGREDRVLLSSRLRSIQSRDIHAARWMGYWSRHELEREDLRHSRSDNHGQSLGRGGPIRDIFSGEPGLRRSDGIGGRETGRSVSRQDGRLRNGPDPSQLHRRDTTRSRERDRF